VDRRFNAFGVFVPEFREVRLVEIRHDIAEIGYGLAKGG
jgi:hypothetical protein